MERLKNLLLSADENRGKWLIGNRPVHYKRLSVDFREADRLAQLGAIKIGAAFNTVLYYSQAVIAGAILSGDYDTAIIVTPSQYGKAIENDCPVLTRHGWKKHGDLQVGDEVIGKDGEFVKVTYVHPKCLMDREVVFSTGERIKCHHNHEWLAYNKNWRGRAGTYTNKMLRNLPTDEMLDKQVPCVLPRKRADKVSKRHNYPRVVDVLPCDPVEGNCITVEGGLYCVGKTLTLTHNSFLMGRICLLLAYEDHQVSVAAAAKDKTDIILSHTRKAVSEAAPEILNKLLNESKKKVDNLDKSLSKTKIGFASGGYTEALTLGDNYEDISRNKAVGIGTDFIVDEAAMISTKALRELGRRQLSSIDGKSKLLVMISNPHQPGYFYDKLTGPADKRTLILWMDALTAAQEGRWTVEQILDSDFAQEEDTRTRYWMCELPTQGKSMFGYLKVGEGWEGTHYLGVDAAYKGKDNICVADIVKGPKGLYVKEVVRIPKPHWIDGVTGQEIVRDVIRIAKGLNAKHVCVDQGYGVWLVMGLQNAHVNVTGVNFGSGPSKDRKAAKHYAARMAYNKRAEMHLDLESLTEDGKVIFSRQAYEKIQDVLPFITKALRTNGTYMIRSKDEVKAMIGRSPDELDAVLLGIHAAITDIRPGYMV